MGYTDLLKSKDIKNITAKPSKRRQAMLDQKGMCAECKKSINPMYSKFIKDGNKYKVICSNCAVDIVKG